MKHGHDLDKIDLQLIRTLHTLITECSVSRAAIQLGQQQPAVSLALRRLRELTGDALLVRSGAHMVPTDFALELVEPAAKLLHLADHMFAAKREFMPAQDEKLFRIAASDTLDPGFLPSVVAQLQVLAPECKMEIHALSPTHQYATDLADGRLDLVVGNWTSPPDHLHRSPLFADTVACLISARHPAARRGWDVDHWLSCAHIAPTPAYPGWRGIIEEQLDDLGLRRNIAVRCAHFGLMPTMVSKGLLVLTTGRQFCERIISDRPDLNLLMVDCPVSFQPMTYYQLWHERSHAESSNRWLRNVLKDSVARLHAPSAQLI